MVIVHSYGTALLTCVRCTFHIYRDSWSCNLVSYGNIYIKSDVDHIDKQTMVNITLEIRMNNAAIRRSIANYRRT